MKEGIRSFISGRHSGALLIMRLVVAAPQMDRRTATTLQSTTSKTGTVASTAVHLETLELPQT